MEAEKNIAPKLTVRDLNFYYGDFRALKDINLTIQEKMVTAFIGPSGCGKSTLLRTFNRMYQLYPKQKATGEVLLDNENILDKKQDLNTLRSKIGMVFQKIRHSQCPSTTTSPLASNCTKNSIAMTWMSAWNGHSKRPRYGEK